MKVKRRKNGEVVDVEVHGDTFIDEKGRCFYYDEVDIIDEPDWQQVRIQAAIAAMPIVADDGYNVRNEQHLIAKYAVELADALIEELKKKGGEQ